MADDGNQGGSLTILHGYHEDVAGAAFDTAENPSPLLPPSTIILSFKKKYIYINKNVNIKTYKKKHKHI